MIVGGGTMLRAARACRDHGAAAVHLLATHALMDADGAARLADPSVTDVTVTDAAGVPATEGLGDKLHLLSVAPLLGAVIAHLHRGEPIGPLLDPAGH
jgi:ribose-phosphate pyrophosphokinase